MSIAKAAAKAGQAASKAVKRAGQKAKDISRWASDIASYLVWSEAMMDATDWLHNNTWKFGKKHIKSRQDYQNSINRVKTWNIWKPMSVAPKGSWAWATAVTRKAMSKMALKTKK